MACPNQDSSLISNVPDCFVRDDSQVTMLLARITRATVAAMWATAACPSQLGYTARMAGRTRPVSDFRGETGALRGPRRSPTGLEREVMAEILISECLPSTA